MRITLLFWIICKSLIYKHTLRRLNRCIKKINIESKVVSPPQLYVHGYVDSAVVSLFSEKFIH